MHLVIDGYNLIHQTPELFLAQDLGRGREALLAALRLYRQKKSHSLTVVFDGGQEPGPQKVSWLGVPVVFSGSRLSADEVIADLAGRRGPGLTVITDDRQLGDLCRRQGALVIQASIFAAKLMDTAQGRLPDQDQDQETGWDFTTRKKGPAKRLSKAKRRRSHRLDKL